MADSFALNPLSRGPGVVTRGLRKLGIGKGFPWIAAAVLLTVLIAALFSTWLAPHNAGGISLVNSLTPPMWMEGGSSTYLLGTDNLGRDILSRIIVGAQVSVKIAAYAIVRNHQECDDVNDFD